ncbi:hypothetical protein PVAG01_00723 [Phlyctema vagabunda]|uniref:Uncharacterized protein n=1 Tax=Phlyctema vagabunda TaxID=108571 RepID=A0ABR4PV26_9HELO
MLFPLFSDGNWENFHTVDPATGTASLRYQTPEIRAAVYPSLLLATKLFHAARICEFFTTWLIDIDHYVPVDPNRIPQQYTIQNPQAPQLYTIPPKNPNINRAAQQQQLTDDLKNIASGFRIRFRGGNGSAHASTAYLRPTLSVDINSSDVQLIMRKDLSDAERMGLQAHLGITLFHELIHPYYLNEPSSELGESAEQNILLGTIRLFSYDNRPPLGFWHEDGWPNAHYKISITSIHNTPTLLQPRLTDTITKYPIPVTTFEDVFQDEFWEVAVKCFGIETIYDSSRRLGVEEQLKFKPNGDHYSKSTRIVEYWATHDRLNLINSNPWEARKTKLTNKLNAVPAENRAATAAQPFLQRMAILLRNMAEETTAAQEYWEQSNQFQMLIKDITRGGTFSVTLLLSRLDDIENHHRELVIRTIKREQIRQERFGQERDDHIRFNRELQDFLQRLQMNSPAHRLQIGPVMMRLDFARLLLVDPADPEAQNSTVWNQDDWANLKELDALFTESNNRPEQRSRHHIPIIGEYKKVLTCARSPHFCWYDILRLKLLRASVYEGKKIRDHQNRFNLLRSYESGIAEVKAEFNGLRYSSGLKYPQAYVDAFATMDALETRVRDILGYPATS